MVIVELIGSISLAIALITAILLILVHIKHKQNQIIYDQHIHVNEKRHISAVVVPFEEFNTNQRLTVVDVIEQKTNRLSSMSIKSGIQCMIPSNEEIQSEIIDSPIKNTEFDQGDSLSLTDQNINIRELIEKIHDKEKDNQTDSDLTSMETNFDNQTIKTDFNQNQQKFSHHSSISNLDLTIPSNLSSSIDLEQFECISTTTSNLSEFLKD